MLQFSVRPVICWLMVVVIVVGVNAETGRIIPADTRLCLDCHTFEFMERAVKDLYKAAHNLDSQTEMLLLKTEDRGLCRCLDNKRSQTS